MEDLIPKPEVIRVRLHRLCEECRDLRRLLKVSVRYHGEGNPSARPGPDGVKLETKS